MDQTLQKIQTSTADTAIQAGQKASEQAASPENVDAITKIFSQFELIYHNQYNKAFPTADKETLAKRLWLSHLKNYPAAAILKATDLAIRTSEFLPSIYSVLKHLDHSNELPNARDAYHECCSASSPKATYAWSHPIVYWTGKACGWNLLSTQSEKIAWPMFKERYALNSQAFAQGKVFPTPDVKPNDLRIADNNNLFLAGKTGNPENTLGELKTLFSKS